MRLSWLDPRRGLVSLFAILLVAGCGDGDATGTGASGGAEGGHWQHTRIEGVSGATGLAILGDTLFFVRGGGKRTLHALDRSGLKPDATTSPRLLTVEVREGMSLHGMDDLLAARGYGVDKLWEAGIDLQGLAAQAPDRLFLADRAFRVVFRANLQRAVGGEWARAVFDGAFTVPGARRSESSRADYRDVSPGLSGLDSTRGRRIDDLVVLERSRYAEEGSTPDTFRMLRLDAYGAPVTRRDLGAYMVGRVPDKTPVEAEAIVHEGSRYLVLRSSGKGSLAPLSPESAPRTLLLGGPTPLPQIEGAGTWRGMARAKDGTLFIISDGAPRDPGVAGWLDMATFEREADVLIVVLGLRLDHATIPALQRRIREELDGGVRALVVDMTDLQLLPSTGVGFLLALAQDVRARSGRLAIAAAQGNALGTLRTMGVAGVFPMHDSRAAAVAAIG